MLPKLNQSVFTPILSNQEASVDKGRPDECLFVRTELCPGFRCPLSNQVTSVGPAQSTRSSGQTPCLVIGRKLGLETLVDHPLEGDPDVAIHGTDTVSAVSRGVGGHNIH